jgi:GNAT superfamily N-acetyltransferase
MSIEKIIIRFATEQDLDGILELWEGMMDFHAQLDPIFVCAEDGAEKFRDYLHHTILQDEEAFLYVAEHVLDHQLIGYCLGKIDLYPPVFACKQHGSIYDTMVSDKHRRKHIGTQLFANAKDWFYEKGITRIELQVAIKNNISPNFWAKMGFKGHMMKLALNL